MKPYARHSVWDFCPDSFTALLTREESCNPKIVSHLRGAVTNWNVPPSRLLDRFTDLNRDYSGRFFDATAGFSDLMTGNFKEAFVNMEPLEDAPYEWWRDTFNPNATRLSVLRVRMEAVPRWQAIGSIYRAWFPDQFFLAASAANDNRPPDSVQG